MISLRKQRGVKTNRNSLLVTGNTSSDALIQFVLNSGCFRNKDVGSLNTKDTFSIYNYLCSLLAYSIKHLKSDVPIIVLIDAPKIPVKALRLILKACQNVLAFRSKHVVIAEPESFFDQQRLSLDILLENYDFKTTLCSKNKLWKYVNVADLADSFAPSFLGRWDDIRKGFEEHFRQNPSYTTRSEPSQIPYLSRLLQKSSSILIELNPPMQGRYCRVFEENDPLGKLIHEEANEEPIYDEAISFQKLPPREPQFTENSKNCTSSEVLDESKDERILLPSPILEIRESISKLLEEQTEAIHQLLEWLQGAGEKWLNSLDEIGESIDEARQLQKQHQQLSTRTEAVVDQAAEISEVVEFLIREGKHAALCDPLKCLTHELVNAVHNFRQRVNQQALIRANSLRLHEALTDFYNESDALLKSLCNEFKPMEEAICQIEMMELSKTITTVEERFELVDEVCSIFEGILNEERRREDLKFVKEQFSLITERRKRCQELVDLHKLKLQQMIHLQTCERDQEQVIQWLEEIMKLVSKDSFSFGLSPAALNIKLSRFEESAKKFREYGKQLSQVSLLLRRSLRLEISPQLTICEKIDSLRRAFDDNFNRYKTHTIQ